MYPSADGDNTPSSNIMDVQQLFVAITLIWVQNCWQKTAEQKGVPNKVSV